LANTDAHTHTHTQPFYGFMDFVWDNPGEVVPEETFTHKTKRNKKTQNVEKNLS